MSAITAIIASAIVSRVVIPTGAFVVGKVLEGLKEGLTDGKMTISSNNHQLSSEFNGLKSVAQIRSELKPVSSKAVNLDNLDEAKEKLLTEIGSRDYVITDTAQFQNNLSKFQQAKSVAAFEQAKKNLTNFVETNHQQVFAGALFKACQNASLKIGFTKIESLPSPLASVLRFSATDDQGRTLITEITAPKTRDTKVETEVLGVSDGSCDDILDAFHQALQDEGVKSQPPKRKFTGGVCDLSAAKDFLAKKILPNQVSGNVPSFAQSKDKKRSQKLNQSLQNQKQ